MLFFFRVFCIGFTSILFKILSSTVIRNTVHNFSSFNVFASFPPIGQDNKDICSYHFSVTFYTEK